MYMYMCACVHVYMHVYMQVWVSTDGNQWITILDYSRLKCYARQRLFFAKMAIRLGRDAMLSMWVSLYSTA